MQRIGLIVDASAGLGGLRLGKHRAQPRDQHEIKTPAWAPSVEKSVIVIALIIDRCNPAVTSLLPS
jgi:hypothetical protein